MLTPSYLLHATEPAEEIAEKLHIDILNRIIERIKIRFERGDDYILTAVDKWQLETLQQAGFLLEDIQKEIAAAVPHMQSEIAEAMEDAGVTALEYDDKLYRDAGFSPVPLTQSPHLIRVLQRDFEATAGDWLNFTQTTAGAAEQAFINACDTAYRQAVTGSISPSQAVREALNELIKDGVYVEYTDDAGNVIRRDTIETATARAVRTGISQSTAHIQLARMDDMDVDLVIVSSHLGARPSHAEWQGKVYSRTGTDYPNFEESTRYGTVSGLCGANCRHSFSPFFEGQRNPFEDFDSEENKKQYELEQRQRTLERRIRNTKREVMGWDAADDKEMYERKAALLQRQNAAYNQFCEENGLKKQSDRVHIAKWNRSEAAKARAAAKKYAVDHPKTVAQKSYKPIAKAIQNVGNIAEESGVIKRMIANSIHADRENIRLDGIELNAQRKVLLASRKVFSKIPQMRGWTKSISFDPNLKDGAIAVSDTFAGTIRLGPDFADLGKLESQRKRAVNLGFNPKGTEDVSGVIIHEYGHQLDGWLTIKGVYGGRIDKFGARRTSFEFEGEVLRRAGWDSERIKSVKNEWRSLGYSGTKLAEAVRFERKEFITNGLSAYALENHSEFFAECFTEYLMSDNPRPIAKAFGEILEEILEDMK